MSAPGNKRNRPKITAQQRMITLSVIIGLILVLTGGGALTFRHLLLPQLSKLPFLPNYQVVDYHTYFALEERETSLVLDDQRIALSMPPVLENNVLYLPATFVNDHMDPFLFWDEYAQALFFTTALEVRKYTPDALAYHRDGERRLLETPIKLINGAAYLPADLVQDLYPYDIDYRAVYNIVTVTSRAAKPPTGALTKKADIRYRPDKKAPIAIKAPKEAVLSLYETDGDYTRVRTADGLLGYVLTAVIGEADLEESAGRGPQAGAAEDSTADSTAQADAETDSPADSTAQTDAGNDSSADSTAQADAGDDSTAKADAGTDSAAQANTETDSPAVISKPLWPADVKINLMWDAIYSGQGTEQKMETPLPDGLNVIAPTWFTLNADTLEPVSYGSRAYTDWAHSQGVQVWAMFSDESGDISHRLLTDAAVRQRTIDRLAEWVDEYNLDGINIDFEYVREADGGYYIEFLRELAPVLRRKGIILSVDVYVPAAWSAYYERGKVGQTVDFVCVMTYDEHYAGSPESGPVASLPFVHQGIEDMLKEVPKEKLLMGLPYYNRLWRELVNNDSPETRTVQHYGMEYTKKLLDEQGCVPEWDPMAGSYYGEYATVEEDEMIRYRIWVEDEYSIAEKLKIFEANDLAGVAGWRRGFENEAVWALLKQACRLP